MNRAEKRRQAKRPENAQPQRPDRNHIQLYFHCQQCLDEKPDAVSPQEYCRLQVGWTKKGVQVWCVRHDCNVVHLDFLGQKIEYAEVEPEPSH